MKIFFRIKYENPAERFVEYWSASILGGLKDSKGNVASLSHFRKFSDYGIGLIMMYLFGILCGYGAALFVGA